MADNPGREKEPLQPVEPSELLRGLRLTTGKAAQFCGVSRRQLCYWTDTGIVPSTEGEGNDDDDDASRRAYDFDALHRVLLIKRALEQSGGLRRAAREVDRYLAQRQRRANELASSIEQKREEFLTEQAERLEALASQVQQLLPRVRDREQLLQLYRGLEWLEGLAERVQAGEVLLEEDAQACLRLVSLLEQAEAKLESLAPSA